MVQSQKRISFDAQCGIECNLLEKLNKLFITLYFILKYWKQSILFEKKNGKCDLKKIIYKVYIEKVNGLDLTKEIIEYLGCKVDKYRKH